jgi:hypothetical protein
MFSAPMTLRVMARALAPADGLAPTRDGALTTLTTRHPLQV